MINKTDNRRQIEVGSGMNQVGSVMYWYNGGQFKSIDEAKGAFRLAYQQGMDGMGASVREWMGLSEEQFEAWMRDDTLPRVRK